MRAGLALFATLAVLGCDRSAAREKAAIPQEPAAVAAEVPAAPEPSSIAEDRQALLEAQLAKLKALEQEQASAGAEDRLGAAASSPTSDRGPGGDGSEQLSSAARGAQPNDRSDRGHRVDGSAAVVGLAPTAEPNDRSGNTVGSGVTGVASTANPNDRSGGAMGTAASRAELARLVSAANASSSGEERRELLERARALAPDDGWLREAYVRQLLRLSAEAAARNDFRAVVGLQSDAKQAAFGVEPLTEAVAGGYVRAAHALLRASRTDDALRLARLGLELAPSSAGAREALAEVAYRENDLEGAVAELERAVRLAPTEPRLRERLETLEKEKARSGNLASRGSAHFILSFDGRADDAAADFALETLERAHERSTEWFGYKPEEKLRVILYSDQSFEAALPDVASWASGVYDGKLRLRSQGAMSQLHEFRDTIAHEYAHAVFHRASESRRPGWLNEGLAMAFAGAQQSAPQVGCGFGHQAPLEALSGGFSRLPRRDASAAYPTAQHAVEVLLAQYPRRDFHRLLSELKGRRPFADAFERTYGRAFTAFASDFNQKKLCP